jgi:phosphoribosylformylglycinamidine (FGAM) synthase PurS component
MGRQKEKQSFFNWPYPMQTIFVTKKLGNKGNNKITELRTQNIIEISLSRKNIRRNMLSKMTEM